MATYAPDDPALYFTAHDTEIERGCDPRAYPETRARIDAIVGRATHGNGPASGGEAPERKVIRRSMANLQEVANRYGLDLVYTFDQRPAGKFIRAGSTMVLRRHIRGVGEETIGRFRVTRGGDFARSWDGEHIETELLSGYAPNLTHPDDWPFFIDGVRANPHDDPTTPWALFGQYVFAPGGERLSHTRVHAQTDARLDAAHGGMVAAYRANEEARQRRMADMTQRFVERYSVPALPAASGTHENGRRAAASLRCEECTRGGASIVLATAMDAPDCSCTSPGEHDDRIRAGRRGCRPAVPLAGATPLALCGGCASDDWSSCGVCGRWAPVGVLHADPMGESECCRCARERTGIDPSERVLTEGEQDPRWLLRRGGGTYENGRRAAPVAARAARPLQVTCPSCARVVPYAPVDVRLHDVTYRRPSTIGTVDPQVTDTYRAVDCACGAVIRLSGPIGPEDVRAWHHGNGASTHENGASAERATFDVAVMNQPYQRTHRLYYPDHSQGVMAVRDQQGRTHYFSREAWDSSVDAGEAVRVGRWFYLPEYGSANPQHWKVNKLVSVREDGGTQGNDAGRAGALDHEDDVALLEAYLSLPPGQRVNQSAPGGVYALRHARRLDVAERLVRRPTGHGGHAAWIWHHPARAEAVQARALVAPYFVVVERDRGNRPVLYERAAAPGVVTAENGRQSAAAEPDHWIATRNTADGHDIYLWSGGALTARNGNAIPGVPIARPRTPEARAVALAAGRLVLGEAGLWTFDELPTLYATARRVADRGGLPGDLREAATLAAEPRVHIRWTEPTAGLRVGYLPRMGWPDTVIVRERGMYQVRWIVSDGIGGEEGVPSGIEFRNEPDLHRWLFANSAVGPRREGRGATAENGRRSAPPPGPDLFAWAAERPAAPRQDSHALRTVDPVRFDAVAAMEAEARRPPPQLAPPAESVGGPDDVDPYQPTGQEFPVPGPLRRVAKVFESPGGYVMVRLFEAGAGEVARASSEHGLSGLAAVQSAIDRAVASANEEDEAHADNLAVNVLNEQHFYTRGKELARMMRRDPERLVDTIRREQVIPMSRQLNRSRREDGDAAVHYNEVALAEAARIVAKRWLEYATDDAPPAPPPPRPTPVAPPPAKPPPPPRRAAPPEEALAGPRGKSRKYTLDDDVAEVLRRAAVDDLAVRLPHEKLDRKLYQRVADALEAAGAKWKKGAQAHVFQRADARDAFLAMLASGAYTVTADIAFFGTPPELADEIAQLVGARRGVTILEPEAGEGAIVQALLDRGANVVAVEYDAGRAARLAARFPGVRVVRGDFLALSPEELGGPFDGVAMNPPFSLDGQPFADVEHVTHAVAFAKRGAPVVAVMSPGARDRDTAKHRTFRKLVIDRGQGSWRDVPAGTFKHAGTNIATVILATRA